MRFAFRSSLTAALVISLTVPLLAASGPPDKAAASNAVSPSRIATLNRGVNLSGWYGGWGTYDADHIATWTTPADFAFLHSIGVQYVRLCIDPAQLTTDGYDSPASVAALARLDHSVDDVLAAGLSLSITIFPRSTYKKALLTPEGADAYLSLWKFLAAHYATRDPERLFFDLMNEPEITDAAKWNALQASVVVAIRAIDKQHTIIATGDKYAGIDELLQVTPLADANVVYTFHFYEPFPFTHQGATWSAPAFAHLHNVPYPGDPQKLGPMIAGATDTDVRNTLAGYASEDWDESVILRRIKQARKWGDSHHVPVICNEFGAFRDTIPVAARAAYLHDVRTALESLHIPWAEWDYRGNFGIVTHGPDGAIVPDAPIIESLGLTLPVPQPAAAAPAPPSI